METLLGKGQATCDNGLLSYFSVSTIWTIFFLIEHMLNVNYFVIL